MFKKYINKILNKFGYYDTPLVINRTINETKNIRTLKVSYSISEQEYLYYSDIEKYIEKELSKQMLKELLKNNVIKMKREDSRYGYMNKFVFTSSIKVVV